MRPAGMGIGASVAVGGTGVLVGGTVVSDGGTGVLVGGTREAAGGTEVTVGGTGVGAAHATITKTIDKDMQTRKRLVFIFSSEFVGQIYPFQNKNRLTPS